MPKFKALCVGIDDYGHPANNLNSCLADTEAMKDLLNSHYDFDEVRLLQNEDATIKNVESNLAWLFDDCHSDDRLVFQFSGHGYQMPKDGVLEEVLVLQNNELFLDDHLSELSQSIPSGVFTAILDSCFSGGMEKILILENEGVEIARPKRWTPIDPKQIQKEQAMLEKAGTIKLKPFCAEVAKTTHALAKDFGMSNGSLEKSLIEAPVSDEVGQLQMNGLLLSACLENETASAKTSKTNGLSAFTFGLVESWKALGSATSSSNLIAATQSRLKAMNFRQTPLVKERKNSKLGNHSFILLEPVEHAVDTTQLVETFWNLFKGNQIMSAMQQGDEKFFGAIVSAVSAVAPHVLPVVLNALKKDYQPGLAQPIMAPQTASGGDEKFFGTIIDVITTTAPHVLPVVLEALKKDYQPGLAQPTMAPQTASGGDEKFFGAIVSAVSAVAPHVLPVVLNALKKDYQPGLAQPTMAPQTASGGDEKFFGTIIDVITTTAPHVLPVVLEALKKDYQPGLAQPTMAPQTASGGDEKFFGAIVSAVSAVAPHVLPVVLNALKKDYQPNVGMIH